MDSTRDVPTVPGPVIKVICSFLPITSRCEARLVSRSWRVHAGEAVKSISLSASQLRRQVFADFTPQQVHQQLQKAAAAEAAAAGATTTQAKEAAAAVQLSAYLQQHASSSSSSSTGLRKRRGSHAASFTADTISSARSQRQVELEAARARRQHELNELHILAVSRKISAAFPAAETAVLLLEVGEYGAAAADDPAVVAQQLLLLLSQCRQLARLRIQVTALGTGEHQHAQQQQPEGQQQQHEQAGPAPAPLPLPAWVQAQQPVAAALAAAQAAAAAQENVGAGEDNDDLLGFDPDDADYCFGWIVRLLQHLQQQQQASTDGSSTVPPAVKLKRQMLQPVLLWKGSVHQQHKYQQQQQQQPWSSDIAAAAADSSVITIPTSSSGDGRAAATPAALCVPLVIEVRIAGAAYPRNAADWQQLCAVSSCAALLLPEHRPALLPAMVKDGVAGLTQLRALHLSVDAGYTASAAALQWGVGVGAAGSGTSSDLTALCQLTRLTHLSLHTQGCSMRDITAALLSLTALRELLLSGNSMVLLPALATRLTQLQMLVLQQQLSLFDLAQLTQHCSRLRYLEALGVTEVAGAAHNLRVYDALLAGHAVAEHCVAVAAAASTLLGPAADSLSRQNPQWLMLPPCRGSSTGRAGSSAAMSAALSALDPVTVALYRDAAGVAGRAAAAASKLLTVQSKQSEDGSSNQLEDAFRACNLFLQAQPAAATVPGAPRPDESDEAQRQAQLSGGGGAGGGDAGGGDAGGGDAGGGGAGGLLAVWWCQLLAAQEQLRQAVMTYAINKMLMAEPLGSSLSSLLHSRDSTPAAAVISLLQLVAAGARAAGAAAVDWGMNVDPGGMVVVREDNMPAGAVEELLDDLMCAAPFGAPGDTTEEQQHQDMAAEQAAAAAWRTQQHMPKQQQQQQEEEEQDAFAATTVTIEGPDDRAQGEEAAAAGTEDTGAAGAAGSGGNVIRDPQALLDNHMDWESYALNLQHWLLHRYSSGGTPDASAAGGSGHAVKRFVSWLSHGSDLSLLCAALPGVESLELAVPPCLAGFKPPHTQPPGTQTLQQLQVWMGSSSNVAIAAQVTDSSSSSSGSTEDGVTAATNRQQQQRWQILQPEADFSASYLAQQHQSFLFHTTSSSSSIPTSVPGPGCYFAHLSSLSVSSLSRHDGAWEPSAVLGDALLASAALGCPVLQHLELSGVLGMTATGLLLLRRAKRLKSLRLEQWTNTLTEMSAQQLPLAVCCLPPGLTRLTLINLHPLTHIHTLTALAAAITAAGGVQGIRAAAQTEAAAAAGRGAPKVDVAAVAAAAESVLAATAREDYGRHNSSSQQQQAPFLGLGIAYRTSAAAGQGNVSSSGSQQLLDDREWWTPAALALLLLDTFFGSSNSSSSSDAASIQQSLASLSCCCRCTVCCSHSSSSSSSLSASRCCLSPVFQDLEHLTVMSHTPSCAPHTRERSPAAAAGGGGVCGGLHPFLAAGLPHARSLQHIQVAAPGAFSRLSPSEAVLYGGLTAANAATLYTLSSPLAAAAAAALRAGAFDAEASLLQRTWRLLTAMTSSSSSSACAAVRGSLSSSYAWLRCLGDLPVLSDVHLDLPLMMPGQLSTLVSAVAQSTSIISLRLHGVALTLHTSHRQLMSILSRLTHTAAAHEQQRQWSGHGTPSSAPAAEEDALERGKEETQTSSSSSRRRPSSRLRVLDVSFTKHKVLAPVGLSLSRSWSAVKAERAAAAAAQELTVLKQMREVLTAARHHITAAAGFADAAAGPGLPPAAAVAMDIAMQLAGGAGGGINQQQLQQWGQMLAQAAEAQGPQPAAAAGAAGAAGGNPAEAAAAAGPAFAHPAPAGAFVLLSNMLMVVDHQIHMVTHHQQQPAPCLMTHAAAASTADKQLVRLLQGWFRCQGVAHCSIRMHGSSPRDAALVCSHGGQEEGAGWTAADTGRAVSDVTDFDDSDSDCSDTASVVNDPHSSSGGHTVNVPLELHLNFWERSGLSGVAEGLGSGFMAVFPMWVRWLTGLGPKLQQSKFWGSRVAFRVWLLTRNVFVGGAVTVLAAVLAAAAFFGWDDRLEGFMGGSTAGSRLGQQLHNEREGGGDDDVADHYDVAESSSSWEEAEAGSSDDDDEEEEEEDGDGQAGVSDNDDGGDDDHSDDDDDAEGNNAHDNGDGDGGEDDGDSAVAESDLLGPAAAAAGGGGGLLGMLGLGDDPAGHADFIEQGIQELLYPDAGVPVPDADVDVTGGVTGVPPQVQLLGQADSAASVGFLLGAVPVYVLGVWGWYWQARWILGRLAGLLGAIIRQLL